MRRWFLVTTVALAMGWPRGAEASLYLLLDHASAAPGETVRGHTAGRGAFIPVPSPSDFPILYLKREAIRMRLGVLEVDDRGDGTTEFVVPGVPGGAYVIEADCPTCSGSKVAPVGQLTVVGATGPAISPVSRSKRKNLGWVVAGLATLVVVAGMAVLRRARSS